MASMGVRSMKRHLLAIVTVLALGTLLIAQADDAWARARSGGSRGSRSYSAPARPSPATPTSPSHAIGQPTPSPSPMARPGLFGGLMGGLAGFALGGLLGSMLFGGLGGGFGGIGMLEILLIGAGLFMLWTFLKRRGQRASEPAYATAGGPASASGGGVGREWTTGGGTSVATALPATEISDLDRGIGHVRQMDPRFDPTRVADLARSVFPDVQTALMMRDVGRIRDRLTPEMYAELQTQCDRLRSGRRTNRVERIAIREAAVTEVWQEGGQDFLTVLVAASLVDYTVDDSTGAVVEGAKDAAQDVEEFWTFTRPVGPNAWKLSAIQSS